MDIVLLNTPLTSHILKKVFSYDAPYYNLGEYERISRGAAETIFKLFKLEYDFQAYDHKGYR